MSHTRLDRFNWTALTNPCLNSRFSHWTSTKKSRHYVNAQTFSSNLAFIFLFRFLDSVLISQDHPIASCFWACLQMLTWTPSEASEAASNLQFRVNFKKRRKHHKKTVQRLVWSRAELQLTAEEEDEPVSPPGEKHEDRFHLNGSTVMCLLQFERHNDVDDEGHKHIYVNTCGFTTDRGGEMHIWWKMTTRRESNEAQWDLSRAT